jgi:integrase/recombinase XerD
MFETLLTYPAALERHRMAPLYNERVSFLEKLRADGRGIGQLRTVACLQLQIIRLLRLRDMRDVHLEELKSAARNWQMYSGPGRLGKPGRSATKSFMHVGKEWLSFHGRLILPPPVALPYERHVWTYCQYLSVQVGLACCTADTHSHRLNHFFQWLVRRGKHLRSLALVDVDGYLSHCATLGWKQSTIAGTAHVLKSFVRFSERRRWSPQKISWGIVGPRFTRFFTPHRGPAWPAVCTLLRSLGGTSRLQKRAKAMCLLLAKFGLRSSEVISLRLSDLDFKQRVMTIRRAKNRRVQRLPMSGELADALRDYISLRPTCACTHVFVTQTSPFGQISNSAMYSRISKKMEELGIESPTKGAHALRHAFAERLRAQGASTEEIGSFLGHRSSKFVGDYIRYSVESLREVADFSISGLL